MFRPYITLHGMGTTDAVIPNSNGMAFFYLEVAVEREGG